MKIGVVFPQTEIGEDPAAIRDYAQAVEALGYTHILAFDSVVGANPDRPGGWDPPSTSRSPSSRSARRSRAASSWPRASSGFLALMTLRGTAPPPAGAALEAES